MHTYLNVMQDRLRRFMAKKLEATQVDLRLLSHYKQAGGSFMVLVFVTGGLALLGNFHILQIPDDLVKIGVLGALLNDGAE